MPPDPRPIPRFIADSSQDGIPHGRFAAQLSEHFGAACEAISDLPSEVEIPAEVDWFPERAWSGRTWVPATARGVGPEGPIEFFGHVSYVQQDGGDPADFRAGADFTDVLAEENPEWRVDLNDDVIGAWRGEAGRSGNVTLVWGRPMVRGAVAATAELAEVTADQEPLSDGRFTLVALDALDGFGDDVFLEVRLWSQRGRELASESLYDEGEGEGEPATST